MTGAERLPYLSLIIPCYNEDANIKAGSLTRVQRYLEKADFSWEVIIINDGSSDDSRGLLEKFIRGKQNYYLLDIPHSGKAAAIARGAAQARGGILLFLDMDQSTPIEEWDKLSPWYREEFDIVIGSRGSLRHGTPFLRRCGSRIFRQLRRWIILPGISDTQCGFKSCRSRVAREIFPQLRALRKDTPARGWTVSAWDVEFLYRAQRNGFRVKEVQVAWRDRDLSTSKKKGGPTRVYIAESLDMAGQVLRLKLKELSEKYRTN